jgi:hypothetical protein
MSASTEQSGILNTYHPLPVNALMKLQESIKVNKFMSIKKSTSGVSTNHDPLKSNFFQNQPKRLMRFSRNSLMFLMFRVAKGFASFIAIILF